LKSIILTAMGATILALTSCSQTETPSAASASQKASSPIVPVSCSKQYHAWNHGQGKDLIATLRAVSSAEAAGDIHALTAALQKARPAVAIATRHPIPACADPRDYWDVLLMHVNAAAAANGSASSVRAAIKDVPHVEHELTAELERTAPVSDSSHFASGDAWLSAALIACWRGAAASRRCAPARDPSARTTRRGR
jgi:hypothetical protein